MTGRDILEMLGMMWKRLRGPEPVPVRVGAKALILLTLVSATSQASPLSLGLELQQNFGFAESVDPSTDMSVDVMYSLNDSHRLRLYQSATVNSVVDEIGGELIQPADTSLWHMYKAPVELAGFQMHVRSGLTLPLSRTSGRNGLITSPNVRLAFNRSFLNKDLSVSVRPVGARYYVNEFTTTVDGKPLNQFALSSSLVVQYKMGKFRLTGVAAGSISWKTTPGPTSGGYEFDVSVNYLPSDTVALRLGYNQNDSYVKSGRVQTVLFDPYISQVYFGAGLSL